jgi:hypothetical protein
VNGVVRLLVDTASTVLRLPERNGDNPGLAFVVQVRQGQGTGADPVGDPDPQVGLGVSGPHVVLATGLTSEVHSGLPSGAETTWVFRRDGDASRSTTSPLRASAGRGEPIGVDQRAVHDQMQVVGCLRRQ